MGPMSFVAECGGPSSSRGRIRGNGGRLIMGVLAVIVLMAATSCTSGTAHPAPSATSTTAAVSTSTTTAEVPPATTSTQPASTPAVEPTLGLSGTAHCQGCGQVEPASLAIEAFMSGRDLFQGVAFSKLQWHGWGGSRATAQTDGYFAGPGEYNSVTVVASDPGMCHGSLVYQALQWLPPNNPPIYELSSYFDTCTGQGVGPGWGHSTTTAP